MLYTFTSTCVYTYVQRLSAVDDRVGSKEAHVPDSTGFEAVSDPHLLYMSSHQVIKLRQHPFVTYFLVWPDGTRAIMSEKRVAFYASRRNANRE